MGIQTQRVLKKNRYTHLQVSRPIRWILHNRGRGFEVEGGRVSSLKHKITRVQILASAQPLWDKGHPAPIQLSNSEDDNPDVDSGISSRDHDLGESQPQPSLITTPSSLRSPARTYTDPSRHRPAHKDGQELETNNGGISLRPPRISPRIFPPQLRRPASAIPGPKAPNTAQAEKPPTDRRRMRPGGIERRIVHERRPEKAALEDEVNQRIEGVPDEEEAQGGRRARVQREVGQEVGGDEEQDDAEEGEDGGLIDGEGGGRRRGRHRGLCLGLCGLVDLEFGFRSSN